MPSYTCKVRATVWRYPEESGWYFITLPKEEASDVKEMFGGLAKGWGSHPVVALIGKTTWKTSVFPDKESGSYLLPLKAAVRKTEGITEDDEVTVSLTFYG